MSTASHTPSAKRTTLSATRDRRRVEFIVVAIAWALTGLSYTTHKAGK